MGFSGTLWGRDLYREPMFGPWTTVDERHRESEDMDPRRKVAFQAPAYPGAPPEQETYVEPDSTGLTDQTPISHTGVPRNPSLTEPQLGAIHGVSHGAEIPQTKTFDRLRKWGDRINLFQQQDHGPPPAARGAGGRPDLVRGLNAFPENNPGKEMYDGEGWRRTWWYTRRDDHDLSQPTRFHRWRIVPRWVAATPVNRESEGQNSVYTGLMWDGLSRSIRTNYDRPRMRRQPGYVGEDIVTDGTEAPVAVSVGDFV